MKRVLASLFVLFLSLPGLSMAKEKFNPIRLADRIIVGDISEKKFRSLKLTDQQIVDVFTEIKKKRGWEIDDVTLGEGVLDYLNPLEKNESIDNPEKRMMLKSGGDCNQTVEMKSGDKNSVYPTGTGKPRGNECGGDSDDIVIEYDTKLAWRNKPDPDKVKWWSNLWWVRAVLAAPRPVGYSGNLAGKGLCSNEVRLCLGSRGQIFTYGKDLYLIYLWYKK